MDEVTNNLVRIRIIGAYRRQITKERFNGIKLGEISDGLDDEHLRHAIVTLVNERAIDILCPDTQLNPHIRHHEAPDPRIQILRLDVSEKYHTCLYPTKSTIEREYDLRFLDEKPFTKAIALGEPQLKPRFFEIGALDRYRQDPRYDFHFTEYAGRLSAHSETEKTGRIPDRDHTSVQTFGLGMDDERNPVVCVFLRYFGQLSAEHQQYWRTYRERQTPAHSPIQNEYDVKYTALRREILSDAVFALGNVLHVLMTHPCAPEIRLPKRFEEAQFEII